MNSTFPRIQICRIYSSVLTQFDHRLPSFYCGNKKSHRIQASQDWSAQYKWSAHFQVASIPKLYMLLLDIDLKVVLSPHSRGVSAVLKCVLQERVICVRSSLNLLLCLTILITKADIWSTSSKETMRAAPSSRAFVVTLYITIVRIRLARPIAHAHMLSCFWTCLPAANFVYQTKIHLYCLRAM